MDTENLRSSLVTAPVVAVLVGFGGSVAVVIAAAEAVGASQAQTASWITALCICMAVTSGALSLAHRMPIVAAWSTPGAALIATTAGVGLDQAVGAFLACAALLILTAALRSLGEAVRRIPTALATAVLAGVLFAFVADAVLMAAARPTLGVPMLLVFVLVRLWSPAWAVIATLGTGLGATLLLGLDRPLPPLSLSGFVLVPPAFDLPTLLGLALPLYVVTMASQNLPGFAVLRADGYVPPVRSILAVTGLASLLSAPLGAHTTCLSAITASICTGKDVHPDPGRRWIAGLVYAAGYATLVPFGASLVAMFASFPPELIGIVAGTALAGPLIGSLAASFSSAEDPFPGTMTFVVTASGLTLFGIGAAFWGLAAGIALEALRRWRVSSLQRPS